MKFAILAATIATLASHANAANFQAAWTIKGDKCDGQVSVGEYTVMPGTCTPKDCAPISGDIPGLSTKTQCVKTPADATKVILNDYSKPYVLLEVYQTGSDCAGAFLSAFGVIADGSCYPSANGKASFNVTWSAETGTVWRQFDDALCKGRETNIPIPNTGADGKTCLFDTIKAFAVPPAAESGSASNTSTTAPGKASNTSTTAPTIVPTPAPTTSAASTSGSLVRATAIATFIAVGAALA